MSRWKRAVLFFAFSALCYCKQKKHASGKEQNAVSVGAFMDMFPKIKLPVALADSSLNRSPSDSLIPQPVIKEFIPDSVFLRYAGKSGKVKWYAMGKVKIPHEETYLFIKTGLPGSKKIILFCFDKDDKFAASLPILIKEDDRAITWLAGMDSKSTISVTRQRHTPDGHIFFKRMVYVFNNAGIFNLILTESNEDKPKELQIYNPIDTVSRKHKLTGDYLQDKRNFISVRDGKNPSVILFFVHFEKNDGECKGELKGEAKWVSPATARYTAAGDPCSLEFTFSGSVVNMKELEGCGNHRDIKCYFNGSYTRQKETKPKPVKPVRSKQTVK